MKYGPLDVLIILAVAAVISVNLVIAQANLVGDSMRPTITDGQIAFYFRFPGPWRPENLTGKIIFVDWPEFWICHRCIGDNGSYIQTKGDGLPDPEPWVPKDRLRGVVLGISPVWGSYLDLGGCAGLCLFGIIYFERKEYHENKQNSID